MAEVQVKNRLGVVDKRLGRANANSAHSGTTETNTKDIAAMRARLTAISGTTFTAARLNTMTVNDMIYAIRLNDEAAGI